MKAAQKLYEIAQSTKITEQVLIRDIITNAAYDCALRGFYNTEYRTTMAREDEFDTDYILERLLQEGFEADCTVSSIDGHITLIITLSWSYNEDWKEEC